MSDNKQATGLDRKLVSTHDDYELRDWANSLGVSQDEVKQAVAKVGYSAAAVRDYIKSGKTS